MEIKRTILAVVLSMAVLLVFQNYLTPPPKAPEPAVSAAPPPIVTAVPGVPASGIEATSVSGVGATSTSGVGAPVTRAVLSNDVLEVELTSKAAAVTRARLREYRREVRDDGPPVELLAGPLGIDLAAAVRLVAAQPLGAFPVYEELARTATRVVYSWTGPNGLRIEKTFTLEPGRYDLELTVRVVNGTSEVLRDRLGLLLIQDFSPHDDSYSFTGPAYFKGGDFEEVAAKEFKEGVQVASDVAWVALMEKYFLVAAVPQGGDTAGLRVGMHQGMEKVPEAELLGPVFELLPGAETTQGYRVYLGPKLASALAPLGSKMDHVVDYGYFDVLAKPLLWFLNAIFGVIGNYGIAIIILTTVIKGLFWPLSAKSFQSMARMKELQPKMMKIKEKYANDKERLNLEVMQLYKSHKVNPLGGCLPMLVQIPFFFALYKILLDSIELRHAPFFLWIQDLSAKDPYYITPLLMGASMYFQQKMTPVTAGNEAQMKMMMYGMPVIFTFMFLNFPAGLVVYWLVNNVLSIAQQGWMLRQGAKKAPA